MAESYNPNSVYKFTDENGSTFFVDGNDPIVQESMTKGLPVSVSDDGKLFIYPYVEQDGNGVMAHIPAWFKESEEYLEWEYVWAPTIPNTEINPYTISIMNKVLDRLGKEAADKRTSTETNVAVVSEGTTTTTQETQKPQQDFWSQNVFQGYSIAVVAISIVIIIAVAFSFVKSVKNKIKYRKEFSGIGWALANAVVGLGIVGIITTVIAYNSINQRIGIIKNKKYKKYAKRQMSDFVKTYAICFGIKLLIVIIINVMRYS